MVRQLTDLATGRGRLSEHRAQEVDWVRGYIKCFDLAIKTRPRQMSTLNSQTLTRWLLLVAFALLEKAY